MSRTKFHLPQLKMVDSSCYSI